MATDWTSSSQCSDRGSVSLLAVCASLVLLSVTCALAMLGQLLLQYRSTQTAADLAALAGAQRLIDGEQEACAQARMVASLNDTELIDYTSATASVLVVARQEIRSTTLSRLVPFVTATSRAGY